MNPDPERLDDDESSLGQFAPYPYASEPDQDDLLDGRGSE